MKSKKDDGCRKIDGKLRRGEGWREFICASRPAVALREFARWLRDAHEWDEHTCVSRDVLQDRYEEWLWDNGARAVTPRSLENALKSAGIVAERPKLRKKGGRLHRPTLYKLDAVLLFEKDMADIARSNVLRVDMRKKDSMPDAEILARAA